MSESSTYRYRQSGFIISLLIIEVVFWSVAGVFWYYISENEPAFRFEHQWTLYLGGSIISLFMGYLLFVRWWKNKTLSKYADDHLLGYLTEGFSNVKSVIKYTLLRVGLSALVVAAANPQYGQSEREVTSKGVDIMIALDISYSMNAEDLVEGKTRLDIAKKNISKLIDQLHGDQIGLVVFAGDAYKQLPITPDYNIAKTFLDIIEPDLITKQGTDIGKAIATCANSFNPEDPVQKVIVVFSDGEDHEEGGVIMAKEVHDENIIVHTIGMGTTKGTPIPMFKNGKKVGFKTDQEGNTVLTKLNEDNLIGISNAGGGSYTRAEGYNVGLDGLIAQINSMEKSELKKDSYMAYTDHFQIFLIIGLAMLFLDTLIGDKKGYLFGFKIRKG